MKSNKPTQQSLQAAMWALGGRRKAAARHHLVDGPSPAHLRHNVQPGAKKPGCRLLAGRKPAAIVRVTPRPPPPGRARGALRRTCASRNDLGSEANPRRCRAGGEPPARRAHLATPHRRLAPQPGHRRPLSVRPRAPTWGRPPATSPLTAVSSSAAIAGANRPAPQPQVWQHRKVRARPALAQAATPERGRVHTRGRVRCRGCRHRSPRTRSQRPLAARRPRPQSMRTGARPPASLGAAGRGREKEARRGAESQCAPHRPPRGGRQSAARLAR